MLTVKGAKSKNILVSGCDMRESDKLAAVGDGAAQTAVQGEFNIRKAAK